MRRLSLLILALNVTTSTSSAQKIEVMAADVSLTDSIQAIYFAQTHVMKPDQDYFGLVSQREALIKVHVVDPSTPAAPNVSAELHLNGNTLNLPLAGPATLPASIPDGPGVVQHRFEDSFTATIPADWVQPGLEVTVQAGAETVEVTNIEIGAPTKVIMRMYDVHYFKYSPGDYPAGTFEEIEAKWPVAELEIRRHPNIVFPELVIPPRNFWSEGFWLPAARVKSKEEYFEKTGYRFDGEQAAALHWNRALKRANGRSGRVYLSYLNIYGVSAGGQAGGFAGVGSGTGYGIMHHELGHALSLPHWGNSAAYPYKGAMYGIEHPVNNETHAGPTWAYDLRLKEFITPIAQANNVRGRPSGTYKVDPMQGGGYGYNEPEYLLNHFSDYSVNQMRNYLENHVVVWNESLGQYAQWNQTDADYTNVISNNGVQFPLQRDVEVISLMASISGSNTDINMVYPPIGPYDGNLIKLFDPRDPDDRAEAQSIFAPAGGCDLSVRFIQGGVEKIYMLAASWEPTASIQNSLITEAINIPASDGEVSRIELLLTPDAELSGLPVDPQILYAWSLIQPDPPTFRVEPYAASSSTIIMEATEGTNTIGEIEYLFTETSGNPGGTSSAWQSSPYYVDTNLNPNTPYTYTVTMRAGSTTGSSSAELSATTDSLSSTGTITVDSTQQFRLQGSNGLNPVTDLGSFDAGGADKLVVAISTEHGWNNGEGSVNAVHYNGQPLVELIQEDAGENRGAVAIFYLNNPGPIGTGTIEVSAANPNGGIGAAYALSGTRDQHGAISRRTGESVGSLSINTLGENSLVIAALGNSGNPNNAGTTTAALPMTQVSSGNWGNQWGSHASGYLFVDRSQTVTPAFITNMGADYSINLVAAEFLAKPTLSSSNTQILSPSN